MTINTLISNIYNQVDRFFFSNIHNWYNKRYNQRGFFFFFNFCDFFSFNLLYFTGIWEKHGSLDPQESSKYPSQFMWCYGLDGYNHSTNLFSGFFETVSNSFRICHTVRNWWYSQSPSDSRSSYLSRTFLSILFSEAIAVRTA